MVVSNGQIREIDISKPAGALRFLRMTDYLLVILCGSILLNLLVTLFTDTETGLGGLIVEWVAVPVLVFLVYTGWRHVGVIDVRVWRAYLVAFSLLLLFSIFIAVSILFTDFANNGGINLGDFETFIGLYVVVLMLAGAFVGLRSVLLLKKMRMATFGVPLVELLRELKRYEGERPVEVKK